jgi:hypothetical protein
VGYGMTKKLPESVSEYMRRIGRKGGRNGKGKRKNRKPKEPRAR